MALKAKYNSESMLLNCRGSVRLRLIGALACALLIFGFLLLLNSTAEAFPSKVNLNGKSCMANGCHAQLAGTIETAVNGVRATAVTVTAGSTFEVDWRYTAQATSGNPDSATMIAVPTGWMVASGTANSPTGFTSWNSVWNNAAGLGTFGVIGSLSDLTSTPVGYAIDFTGSLWHNANGTAADNAQTGSVAPVDRDGTASLMGADATVTVPSNITAGSYSVVVIGAGHNGTKKSFVSQTITVTVKPAVNSASPNSMAQGTGPATVTINGAGFSSTGLSVSFSGANVTAGTATYVSPTQITVPVTVAAGAAAGARDVTVTCSGQTGTGAGVFSVTLAKTTPSVTAWPTASAIIYGQTLASSVLTGGTASVAGTFAFTAPSTTPNAGTVAQSVIFTPTDTINYNTVTGSTNVTVAKATPSVTAWPTASAIIYGQTLASSSLNGGTSTPAGTFAFTTPSTAPPEGVYSASVTFTPVDTSNYNTATGSVDVTVNSAIPPTVAITYSVPGPYKSNANITITATFDKEMADSPVPQIAVSGANTLIATNMTKSSTTVYTYSYTAGTGDGSATVSIPVAKDLLGTNVVSIPTSGAVFTVDNTPPVISATTPPSDSYRNNANVGYTLNDAIASGSVTFTRTGGTADPSSPQVYTFISSDMSSGSHNINTAKALVNGAIYSISFDAIDAAGNAANQVTSTNVIYDTTAAVITLTSPGGGSRTNNARLDYSLSKDIQSGKIIYTRTGGVVDGASPHTYNLSGVELSSGSHAAVDTGFTLVDGAVYSVSVENVIDLMGNPSSIVVNTNITFDSTAVAITGSAPAPGSFIKTAAVSYTLSELAQSGTVTFSRTGGALDAASPQVFTLTGGNLGTGVHSNVDTSLALVDGAIYTVSFDATDQAGNPATTVSNAMLAFDTTLPTLSSVGISSNNADTTKGVVGDVVTVAFTSAESITAPSVTIAGGAAAVTGGPVSWSATRTLLAGDLLGAVPFSIASFSDMAGNAGSTVTSVTDSSSVTKIKGNPNVTGWPTATDITYGQTLASSSLSGGAATPVGTFAFTTPFTAPLAGTALQAVTFTPTDTTNYNTATGTASVTVNKADQSITFGAIGNKTYGDPSFTLTATGGASGNPVVFTSSNLLAATVSGDTVTIVGAGITTITASQPGNANYNAASDVFQALAVDKADQTITFNALPSKSVGDADFDPGAAASSTLTVTYISSNTAVATIIGGQIHIVGAGSTDITASQTGNTNFNIASDVIRTFTVSASATPTLSVTVIGNGSVNSNPSGIACTSGTCSNSNAFISNQSVTLTADPSWNYVFGSWTGPCTLNANVCTVNVNGLTEVTASFTAKQLVKVGTEMFASIQDAYNAAVEGAVLLGRNEALIENLVFDRTVNVSFKGGNDINWNVAGDTIINGTVTLGGIAGGSVAISNMVIR